MEHDLPPPSHRENTADPDFPPFAGSMPACEDDAKHRYGFVAVSLAGAIESCRIDPRPLLRRPGIPIRAGLRRILREANPGRRAARQRPANQASPGPRRKLKTVR